MSKVYEMAIVVERRDNPKRQSLTSAIDFAICAAGLRIKNGTYKVTIERIGPPPEGGPLAKKAEG